MPLSGGRRLIAEQPLDAAGRVERDARSRRPCRSAARRRRRPRRTATRRRPPCRIVGDDPGGHAGIARRVHARRRRAAARHVAAAARRWRQDERLDHPGDALVGQRRRDVAGDRPDLGRCGRHRRAVADLGEHLEVVPLVADRQRRPERDPVAGARSQRTARPFETPGATNSRNRGWLIVTSATPGEPLASQRRQLGRERRLADGAGPS